MESKDIQKYLPHRYPFLLIDRIIEVEPGKKGIGLKNFTGNEWFFQGHSLYPPNLLLESLAQVGGVVLAIKAKEENPQATVQGLFAGVSDFTFLRCPARGEQVRFKVEVVQSLSSIYKFSAEAFVKEEKIAGGQLLLSFLLAP